DAPFAAPYDRDPALVDALADRGDAFRLQQEMIIDEIDGAVAELLEIRELAHHVLRTARAPLAFIEDRNVAENARPRAAARRLHGRKALHREYRRHIERHRFDEIEGQ